MKTRVYLLNSETTKNYFILQNLILFHIWDKIKQSNIYFHPSPTEDHLTYIIDEKVKENCIKAIEKIKKFSDKNIEVVPTKYRLAFKFRGRNFAICNTKRESIVLEWKSEEEEKWPYKTGLKTMEQINEVIDNNIKRAFSLVGGKI